MKIKLRCPYFNNGMSYKVLSEKAYKKLVRNGKMEKNSYEEALRYFGEHPVGNIQTLDKKFGRQFVDNQLVTGANISCLTNCETDRNNTYFPGTMLAFRLDLRGLANTQYYDRNSEYTPGFPPNRLQRAYKFICDILHPPKIID